MEIDFNGIANTIREKMEHEISNNGIKNHHHISIEMGNISKSQARDIEDFFTVNLINYHVAIKGSKDRKYIITAEK